MYEHYKIFESPTNADQTIWRYMDLKSFISLIDKSSLFFTKSTCFKDKYEGRYPNVSKYKMHENRKIGLEQGQYQLIKTETDKKSFLDIYKRADVEHEIEMCERTFINCWHVNNDESAAMWQLYTTNGEGIAIKSSFIRLCECFNDYVDKDVYIGKVKYIDFENTDIYNHHSLEPFINKRRCFEHEHELRAVILHSEEDRKIKYGCNIPVNLESLIEKIYVSPDSPVWFYDIIKAITDKYGFTFDIIHSQLYKFGEF